MPGKTGMRKRAPLADNQERQRMWNSMRRLRNFTAVDLESTAETATSHTRKYILALVKAQYVAITQAKREGVIAGHAHYRLLRNTGPVAPRISRDGLFDINLADPYLLPENKRINRHAHALLKKLRELTDAIERDADIARHVLEAEQLMCRCVSEAKP